MRIAIDTNAYGEIVRGNPQRMESVRFAEEVYLPMIVYGELLAGFQMGGRRAENETILRRFLASTRTSLLPVDDQTASCYADLRQMLRQNGTPIPSNDIWIAASVIQHGLILCTSDEHFRKIPYLPII